MRRKTLAAAGVMDKEDQAAARDPTNTMRIALNVLAQQTERVAEKLRASSAVPDFVSGCLGCLSGMYKPIRLCRFP